MTTARYAHLRWGVCRSYGGIRGQKYYRPIQLVAKPIARQTLLGKVGRIPHIWAVGAAGAPETSGRTRHRSLGKRSPTERLLVERFRGHAQKMADTAGAVRNL
jgi:hypothetical protein